MLSVRRILFLFVCAAMLLPDLVEAHIANLNLRPIETKHEDVFVPHSHRGIGAYQPALALCG